MNTPSTNGHAAALSSSLGPLLCVRGVTAFYGNIMALRGVDIDVN